MKRGGWSLRLGGVSTAFAVQNGGAGNNAHNVVGQVILELRIVITDKETGHGFSFQMLHNEVTFEEEILAIRSFDAMFGIDCRM